MRVSQLDGHANFGVYDLIDAFGAGHVLVLLSPVEEILEHIVSVVFFVHLLSCN